MRLSTRVWLSITYDLEDLTGFLAASHNHDEGYQNEQDRKRPEDD
jgi:hypothetical protein